MKKSALVWNRTRDLLYYTQHVYNTSNNYALWQVDGLSNIRYRSIITSHLQAWTCVVPRQKLAWTTFPHSVEYTQLVCSQHVARVDIPHAIYTCGFSTQCTRVDMHVYLWHCYFMFVLPVVITC